MANVRILPPCELLVQSQAGPAGPCTCGVPWPRGAVPSGADLELLDQHNQRVPVQTRVLDAWPDRSARWTLVSWQGSPGVYRLVTAAVPSAPATPDHAVRVESVSGHAQAVDTGAVRFDMAAGTEAPTPFLRAYTPHGPAPITCNLTATDEQGRLYYADFKHRAVEDAGPLRTTLCCRGALQTTDRKQPPLAKLDLRLHFFAGSGAVQLDLTVRNPRKADHPGGMWDLGNGGSIYLRDMSITLALPTVGTGAQVFCSAECGEPFSEQALPFELYQDSSGGENWQSRNHLNRHHVVPQRLRGYRQTAGQAEQHGLRATPAVYLQRGPTTVGLAVPWFWQNFPKAIEAAAAGTLILQLFPRQYGDVHEIQGGEQKTQTFALMFGSAEPIGPILEWWRTPPHIRASPDWYCASGALPYLTPRVQDTNTAYLQLVDAALDGADTFDHKREIIDEYGWRHFGDIYGDHEAVFHKGPTPLISHYNNQYDPVAGFAYQFFRSGDFRWLRHMEELAAHVIDIDLYHTDQDKAAYNHGLFWHTYHYVDVDTGTHRSYPRAAKTCGGGPANEQNYATGLMLHYFLTGSSAARAAVLALGRWVIDMDDGNKTPFRWLARGDTGLASSSRTPHYHGPGRGAANSIATLLDAHRLSGEPAFLAKAEQLLRRCIHPTDDVAARNLLDAENRWFYTMFLQSLGRYLDYKAERGELDERYAYARASLLHYARWMADHEYPYLEKPEILEYPTETWVAQDMRKSEIFKYAALHATGAERARFLERSEFFFRYVTTTLPAMPTRSLARPVVLLLSFGFMHAYFQQYPDVQAPAPRALTDEFGRPEEFVPQKVRALKRFKALVAGGGLAGLILTAWAVSWLLRWW